MKSRAYRRRSQKEIHSHLKKQSGGNLSIKAYCKKHNLNYATFMYWKHSKKENSPSFVQISIPTLTPSSIEIMFPNGIQAKVSPDQKSAEHMQLLKSLMEISNA